MSSCRCGATWTGLRAEHCPTCHHTFKSTTAGDKHRTGDHAVSTGPTRRRCLTVSEMVEKGMGLVLNPEGHPTWTSVHRRKPSFWPAHQGLDGLPGKAWATTPAPIIQALLDREREAMQP